METEQATVATTAAVSSKTNQQLADIAARMMVGEKKSAEDTMQELVKQGANTETAAFIISEVNRQLGDDAKTAAKKDMLYGTLWCIGGSIVTAVTYSAASSRGGTYFVFWGAIVFGGFQFLKGLYNYARE